MDAEGTGLIFEWDEVKNRLDQAKHGVSFEEARGAFSDPERLIFADLAHSDDEERLFCLGWTGRGVITVRFTYRGESVRIFRAGYWRKGRGIYDHERGSVH